MKESDLLALECVKRWLNEVNSEVSKQSYIRDLRVFTDHAGVNPDQLLAERVQDLRSDDVVVRLRADDRLRRFFEDDKAKATKSSKAHIIAAMKSFYKANGLALALKTPNIKRVGVDRIPTREEIQRLVQASDSARDQAMCIGQAENGMRIGSWVKIEWRHIADELNPITFIPKKIPMAIKIPDPLTQTGVTFILDDAAFYLRRWLATFEKLEPNTRIFNLSGDQAEAIVRELGVKIGINPGNKGRQPFHSHCLPYSSVVYTGSSIAQIGDLVNGLKSGQKRTVLTKNGKIESVTQGYQRKFNGSLIKICVGYTNIPLLITPEHPVLAIKTLHNFGQRRTKFKKEEISEEKLDWIPAGEMDRKCLIAFPRIKEIHDLAIITSDLAELFGWYVAEGCYDEKRKTMRLAQGSKKTKNIHRMNSLIEKCFGQSAYIYEQEGEKILTITSESFAPLFIQFGHNCYEKTIPSWFFYLPKEKQFSFLRGWFGGDGYIRKYAIEGATVSRKLAYQLRLLLARLGILHGFHQRRLSGDVLGRKCKSKDFYVLSISGQAMQKLTSGMKIPFSEKERNLTNYGWVSPNFIFFPIKKIEQVNYNKNVYNLQVSPSETYVTLHGVLHNCFRKRVQTILEDNTKRKTETIPLNWVDLMLDHIPRGSQGEAYSLPSVDQLRSAYAIAANQLRVF